MDLWGVECEVDGNGSGSCSVAGFDDNVKTSGCVTRTLLYPPQDRRWKQRGVLKRWCPTALHYTSPEPRKPGLDIHKGIIYYTVNERL